MTMIDPRTIDPETCAKCGGHGDVIDKERGQVETVGYRRRRRQCKKCHRRWSEYTTLIHPREYAVDVR
jgi:transcriptional regulator NrdR family protein